MYMVRKLTKFLKLHADKETQALFQTFVINETGKVNIETAIRSLVKLNYKALAAQSVTEIAEAEEEAKEQAEKQA